MGRFRFSGFRKSLRRPDFWGTSFATNAVPEKFEQKGSTRGKEKTNAVSKKSIFAKMTTIRPLTPTFALGHTYFNRFANFGMLETNEGALELSHQGEVILLGPSASFQEDLQKY